MPLANAVTNPIINDPFTEPGQHYDFSIFNVFKRLFDVRKCA